MSAKAGVIQKCLWLVCLVGLFIPHILSLDCNSLDFHLRRLTWQNLRFLNSMSNSFPVECLRESKAFELPKEILSYTQPLKRDIRETFYEISKQAFNIFSRYAFQSIWEEKHLRQIQIGLDQQLQYLEQCLTEEEKENEDMKQMEKDEGKHPGAMVSQLSNLNLKRYFRRIGIFLKDKKFSHCAREIVRLEIIRCFYYFLRFTAPPRRK
ncbi:interferon kappa [Rhinolophus ferrumequinum]|uniref:Interferon kappa n=1 Tax=Rhinolophus ferrumequinum TaxID=59479 RepID=A0A671FSR9_RHIFE|nr:interferon kappa [Rhinolophus ferrumequinum]KAF6327449.1 interferon kappa [Rhinolophus ferrumequinum]